MICDKCKRSLNSFLVMPIHQHAPNCPERIEWEKEHGEEYPKFIEKEYQSIIEDERVKE